MPKQNSSTAGRPAPRKPKRCVIYARISLDRTGEGAAVDRQETECRELATRLGLEVTDVYIDNDISATSGKPRPAFETMLEATPPAILVWHVDRLVRRTKELERVIELGCPVHSVAGGDVDLSNPAGIAVAKTIVTWAEYEGRQKSERQRAAARQRRAQGTDWWTTRPFGYTTRGKLVSTEAAALRETYRRCAGGDLNLARHAKRMTELGFTTTGRARPLTSSTVRQILLAERNLGSLGVDQLIDEPTWMAVRDALLTRSTGGGQTVVGLLCGMTGVLRCGVCGGHLMTGNAPAHTRSHRKTYQCATGSHIVWPKEQLDELISQVAAAALTKNRAAIEAAAPDTPDADPGAALHRLALDFASGRLTVDEFADAADREKTRAARQATRATVLGDWADLTHEQRRAVLATLIDRIDLPSRGRGRGGVDPDVVLAAIVWR